MSTAHVRTTCASDGTDARGPDVQVRKRLIPVHVVWLGPLRYVVVQGEGGLAFVRGAGK